MDFNMMVQMTVFHWTHLSVLERDCNVCHKIIEQGSEYSELYFMRGSEAIITHEGVHRACALKIIEDNKSEGISQKAS